MTLKRSVLDRCELYSPAPKISGQASYGGIPVKVYSLAATIFGSLSIATILCKMVIAIIFGSSPQWMLLIPFISTALLIMFVLKATHKRRDVIVILKEAHDFEKWEQKKRNS